MNPVEAKIAYLVCMEGAPALDAMGDRVSPDMLENEGCKLIFKEARKMHADGKYVDATTLPKSCADHIPSIVADHSTSMAYLEHHVKELHQLVKWRIAQTIAKRLESTEEDSDFEEIFGRAILQMEEADDDEANPSIEVKVALTETLKTIEEQIASTEGLLGYRTGFEIVSTKTQGMQGGKLWLLAGLPSSGKSMLAQAWVKAAMLKDKACVHAISLEMSRDEWMRRLIADMGAVDVNEAILTKCPQLIAMMKTGANRVADLPFSVSDKGGISLYSLQRKMKSRVKAGDNIFIIDHLGLLDHRGKELEGYKKTTSWCKAFAKKHDVFVLVLCQLNGKGEEEAMAGKDPRMGWIAYGSSGPNQDADCIFILTRDQELHCCKNRGGLMNWNVQVEMNGPFCKMREAKYAKPTD